MDGHSPEEVHIWKAFLTAEPSQVASFSETLSEDELQRADRFRLKKHRDRFVIARAILRNILGRYLNKDPHELRFQYGPQGKPALDLTTAKASNICFNLSHSADCLVVALSDGMELGIDVEKIQHSFVNERIVREVFSAREQVNYYSSDKASQTKIFFDGWTRKEAYLKARGIGLTIPLSRVEILECAEGAAQVFEGNDQSKWAVYTIGILAGYVASLVVAGKRCKFRLFDFGEGYAGFQRTVVQ